MLLLLLLVVDEGQCGTSDDVTTRDWRTLDTRVLVMVLLTEASMLFNLLMTSVRTFSRDDLILWSTSVVGKLEWWKKQQ